jgi:hypothetical protein
MLGFLSIQPALRCFHRFHRFHRFQHPRLAFHCRNLSTAMSVKRSVVSCFIFKDLSPSPTPSAGSTSSGAPQKPRVALFRRSAKVNTYRSGLQSPSSDSGFISILTLSQPPPRPNLRVNRGIRRLSRRNSLARDPRRNNARQKVAPSVPPGEEVLVRRPRPRPGMDHLPLRL